MVELNQDEFVNRIDCSSDQWPFLGLEAGNSPASDSCRKHQVLEWSPQFVDVEHRQHGKGPVEALGVAVHPQHPFQTRRLPSIGPFWILSVDQRIDLRPRHQPFHACQKLRLSRRPVVFLESLPRHQLHLLRRRNICNKNSLSENMSYALLTAFKFDSTFPLNFFCPDL